MPKPLTHYIIYLLILTAFLPIGLPAQENNTLDKDSIQLAERVKPAIVGLEANVKDLRYYGTGAIIHPDGIILTTTCVIPPGATNIKVYLSNNKVLPAQILAMDEAKETTLLKIEEKNLPYLLTGDSDHIKLGQSVYTLGNVLHSITDDGQTAMTKGIISGLYTLEKTNAYRLESRTGRYKGPVIETTAPINGGVDGGPLIASDGTIIGLITLNYAKARWLGLAIPINQLKPFLKDHKAICPLPFPSHLPETPRLPAGRDQPWAEGEGTVDEPFTHIVSKVSPFIVGVKTEFETPPPVPEWPHRLSPELEKKYKDYVTPPEGYCSGVAIDPSGLVLTSYRNVTGTIKSIKVFWQDDPSKKEYPAEIVGWDEGLDIVLLKTSRSNCPAVDLNQTPDLKIGQWSIVMGFNPDLTMIQPTLTVGIVSALDRLKHKGFQLDAEINYGNFGAPVFDINNQFIGLVGQYGSVLHWGMNSGIGMAVTATEIKQLLPRLKRGEKIKKEPAPFLGVQPARGALDIEGVQIDLVLPGTAASEAGIKRGDIIIEFNGVKIKEWRGFIKAINSSKVGDKVKIKIRRGRKTKELEAVMGERP